MKQLVIGAGLSGLMTAAYFTTESIPVIIFDREKHIGGMWNQENNCYLVNPESRAQVDPVVFRPFGDFRPLVDRSGELFEDICQTPDDVMEMFRDVVKRFKLDDVIVFQREVVGWQINEDKTVRVRWRDVESGAEKEEVFAGLHIRTGTLSKFRNHHFPGEEHYKGVIAQGIRGDVPLGDYKDKDVVVVGGGSFTTENAIRALKGGARKVTLICRTRKLYLPLYASYQLSKLYSMDSVDPVKVQQIWAKNFEMAKKFWNATKTEEICYNSDTIRLINNREHYIFNHGLPSVRVDVCLLASYYGLVEFIHDEVDRLTENSIVTKSGREIKTDFVVKAFGFSTDVSLLKDCTIHERIFVNGHANVTSNIHTDTVLGSKVVGPDIPAGSFFLLSLFLFVDLDVLTTFFMRNPEKFEAFRKNPLLSNIGLVDNVDYSEIVQLFTKVLMLGDTEILEKMAPFMTDRRKMYDELLPEKEFLKYNKRLWDNAVEYFAAKTGKEKIPYPWNDQLL